VQVRESSPAKDRRSNTVPRHQPVANNIHIVGTKLYRIYLSDFKSLCLHEQYISLPKNLFFALTRLCGPRRTALCRLWILRRFLWISTF